MLRSSAPRLVAAIAAVSLIGAPTLNAGPAAASAPPVPGTQLRAVPLTPIVAGPAPLQPTLVPATPRVSSRGSLHAFSTTSTFVVNYDAGFNANPAAKAAFQFAVDQWSNVISSPVPIVVDAQFSPLPAGVLGSAGPHNVASNFTGRPIANTWYPIALANALHGTDLDPNVADIDAQFSSTFGSFYFGTDGQTGGKYDFASVVLHELGHGLGFLGAYTVAADGTGSVCCRLVTPLAFDRFTSSNGQALDQIAAPSVALGNALTSQAVQFSGPQTLGAGLGPAQLYAPAAWQGGSSYSHLDETVYGAGNPNSLMTPAIGADEVIHAAGPLALGILADTGWTLSNQPILSVATARIVEGNADTRRLRFNLSLSSPAAYPISVNYNTVNRTATDSDYVAAAGTVVFPAGTTAATTAISVRGDTTVEPSERFVIRLSGVAGAILGTPSASGYILNDDTSGDPQVSVGSASIVEGRTGVRKLRMMITLSKKLPNTVSVHWATSAGTATAGSDYTEVSGTARFAPGVTDRPISIDIIPDSQTEADESFQVSLTAPNGTAIRRAVGIGTIINDD